MTIHLPSQFESVPMINNINKEEKQYSIFLGPNRTSDHSCTILVGQVHNWEGLWATIPPDCAPFVG